MFFRLMEVSPDEDELRIYRDKNGIIKITNLRDKWIYLKAVVKRISVNCPNYNMFLKNSFFPVNQTLSSKMSSFIKHFKINEMVDSHNQFAFAVIEHINGESILIGPFTPIKVDQTGKHSERHHTEPQCIPPIQEYVKKNKSVIKGIYMFTKLSPCLCIDSECDPCMIQLARFSEEMFYDYNIDVYITFQDMYGASGNVVKKLKYSSSNEDTLIEKKVLGLKDMSKKLRTLEFTVKLFQKYQRKDTSTTVKSGTEKKSLEPDSTKVEEILKAVSPNFPSKSMTLHEFKNYIEKKTIKSDLTKLQDILKAVSPNFPNKSMTFHEFKNYIEKKTIESDLTKVQDILKAVSPNFPSKSMTLHEFKNCIEKISLKSDLKNVQDILKAASLKCPSKSMTLHEFKNYGEGQANEIKIQLENLNISEEHAGKICAIFYYKWCHIVYEEYEKFIYEKLSECFNTFAVDFAYKDIKAITSHFNLERVVVTL